jgi:hypothetical protein
MNIDLGSPILDVAIGLSFVFFLLSLIASAVNEGIAGVLNLRGKTLEQGLSGMLGNVAAARLVLEHNLVRTELDKDPRKNGPRWRLWIESFLPKWLRKYERASAYLDPAIFAVAYQGVATEVKAVSPAAGAQVDRIVAAAKEDAKTEKEALENWFDTAMDRVSGWYKRKAQIFLVLIAIGVAVGLNANAILIAKRLDSDPATRTAVVATAEKALANDLGTKKGSTAVTEIEEADEHFSTATKQVAALNVPLFWSGENKPSHSPWETVVFGWLLTVIAISLGAPFWFDALSKLANLRTAGKRPEESGKPKTG